MYYKITNKESEVYKKLHEMRTREHRIHKENIKAIEEKISMTWDRALMHGGQQNFNRVTEYVGFEFNENWDNICYKTWKESDEHPGVAIPNRRFKLGKEMHEFLQNGLKGSRFDLVSENLGLKDVCCGRFSLPFVEIVGDILIMYLDDKWEPELEDVIEITKKEFNEIRKGD